MTDDLASYLLARLDEDERLALCRHRSRCVTDLNDRIDGRHPAAR